VEFRKKSFWISIYKNKKIITMEITLSSPKKIVLQEEKSKDITKLTVSRVVDLPKQKVVRCFIEELDEPVVLWEGAAYDAAGQWTDADVEARLTALYTA
jgi:hypothetical protein